MKCKQCLLAGAGRMGGCKGYRRRRGLTGAGCEGTFWGDENVLYLDGGVDYVGICIFKN